MENALEANERTLVMFDAVCSGLQGCLALVHQDIKQMTEHRNQLAIIEQQQLQAKLIPAQQLMSTTDHGTTTTTQKHNDRNLLSSLTNINGRAGRNNTNRNDSLEYNNNNNNNNKDINDDLKLLDKRLADSFSQAMSLHDIRKSSLLAKRNSRPSIFQVLLGKGNHSNKSYADKISAERAFQQESTNHKSSSNGNINKVIVDNKQIIDDINRQTRLAMQYSKQLEAHLYKIEDLRARYEMHLKMGLAVKGVARAYLSSASIGSTGFLYGDNPHSPTLQISSQTQHQQQHQQQQQQDNNHQQNIYVSTLSLNGSTKRYSRRANVSKLISNSINRNNTDQSRRLSSHHQQQQHYQQPQQMQQQQSDSKLGYGFHNSLSKSSLNLTSSRASLKSTNNNKSTIKEFIENISKIENEFEAFMGSFLIAVDDIQGFARVCQGDVFEITIKYGESQKFKTKIAVLKDNSRKCDNRQTVFKANIIDRLTIKAYECKGLGKRVLLGHKLCETRDLFTARSQLMTVSLNQTGSIKLNLVVTWNALHLAPSCSSAGNDISHISLPPTPVSSSTLSSLSSVPSLQGTTTMINIQHNSPNHSYNNSRTESLYHTVDPTYGYYIPPPDYINDDARCEDY